MLLSDETTNADLHYSGHISGVEYRHLCIHFVETDKQSK